MSVKEIRGRWQRWLSAGLVALAVPVSCVCVASLVGCQTEYGGFNSPSGKYMHDDVQYFAPAPNHPFPNTQAAAQRARMQTMGIDPTASTAAGPASPTPSDPGTVR